MRKYYNTPELKLLFKSFFTFLLIFGFSTLTHGQDLTLTTPGSNSFIVPAGVVGISVECWGAGGAGGGSTNQNQGGSGGGGGGYTTDVLTVTPGQTVNYTVGAGGTGSNGAGTSGSSSTILTLTANGGTGGAANNGAIGTGGTASGGTTNTTGNNGIAGGTSGGNGGDGANSPGSGGAGVLDGPGDPGLTPGGGGGGAERSGGGSSGGAGGSGQIEVTYLYCTAPSISAATSITSSSATINWSAASPAPSSGYEWEVRTSGAGGSGATGLVASGSTGAGVTTDNVTGLSGSITYYVYVRSNCGSSTYSSWAGPVSFTTSISGDEPCDAIPLTVGTSCSTITGTNVGATASSVSPLLAGCGSHDGTEADVWYTTTVPANGAIQVDAFLGTMTDPVIAVYTASSCGGPLTLIDCDDDAGVGLEAQLQLSGLTAGSTLYIRVWRYNGGGAGTFGICATSPSSTPPPNDLCSSATTLNCGDNDIAGTTSGASLINSGVSCTMSNYGVWYSFVGDGDLSVVTVNPESGFDIEMSVNTGTCAGLSNVACIDSSGAGGLETYSWVTTNGVTYYIYVADPFSGSGAFDVGNFTISRNCQTVSPPPNDDCSGAIDLVVNGSCVTTAATTQYATNSTGIANPSCSGYSGGDVWFTVTVPPSLANQMTISTQNGVVTDSGMAVYSGTCGGTLTEITCENDSGMTSIDLDYNDGITTGDVLYVRVWETGNNNNGSFTICVTAPVTGTNDVEICLGEASQPLSTDLFCNTGATTPHPLTGTLNTSDPQANRPQIFAVSTDPCSFAGGTPRYYDTINFTVTATGTYVFDISASFDTMGYIVEQGFTPGVCGSGTFIAADDDSGPGLLSQITANLIQGVNYTLVTTHFSSFASLGSYTWTVGLTPTSAEWYTAPTGGSPVAYGAFFNPVTAGYIADTNTAGTTSFYVACDGTSSRTQVDFIINSGPSSVTISGAEVDCNNYEITVTVDEPSNNGDGWYIEYTIGSNTYWIDDGSGLGLLPANNPYTFTVTDIQAPSGTAIAISYAISNTSPYCETTNFIGTVSTSYNCSCVVWDGSAGDDNWNTASNWDTNMVPTLSDCVVIPFGDPIILNGSTNAQVLSLSISSGATLTVQNEMTLTAQDFINGPGTILLQGIPGTTINSGGGGSPSSFNSSTTANLIQINNTATNTAVVTLQRHVLTRTQDYVYWSSPVAGINPLTNFTTSLVYEWDPTIFTNATTQFGNWISPLSASMEAGKGYIARGPSGGTSENADWAMASFTGVPHNGIITQNIRRGTYTSGNPDPDVEPEDDNWNLVGNPYPSNLDVDLFLQENSTLIAGYINLWTHGIQIRPGNSPNFGDFVLNYDIDDYLTYNLGGSTAGGHSASFDGYLGSGQGFFVQMLNIGTQVATNEYETTIEFNNSMRTNQEEMFFRTAQQSKNTSYIPTEKHRIWLDLIQPDYTYQTTLLGYIQGATMYNDHLYDAKASNNKKIYSFISGLEETFVIQSRALPFDESDIITLGVVLNQVGEYAINLNSFDGLFETTNQSIFIEDLELGIIHDLRQSAYFFTVNETGTFNNRFVLRYTNTTLSVDDKIKNEIRIMAPNSEYIKVSAGINQIQEIKVYDLLGRILVHKQNINSTEYTINNIPKANGAYIVKATLANGIEKIQKVVLK